MSGPARLVAVVGSLRAASTNRALFGALGPLLPDGVTLEEAPLVDVPLYNGDLEAEGYPAPVVALRAAVEAADGLLIITPEYNRSIPAVTKNAVDWLSRMPGDSPLSRSIVGIVAATPGRHDAAGVRKHLAESLAGVSGKVLDRTHGIASINRVMADGRVTDLEVADSLAGWLQDFTELVDAHR